jgi:hypothetical protein
MKAHFVRGEKDPFKTLRIGHYQVLAQILWNAEPNEDGDISGENVIYLDDGENQNDPELLDMIDNWIKDGDKLEEIPEEKSLYLTEIGPILKVENGDYNASYFVHTETKEEIEKILGRKIKGLDD